jgi:tripartite-type tricarboxylate transporter receptor subunit TctC
MGWFPMQWFRRSRRSLPAAAAATIAGAALLAGVGAIGEARAAYPEKPIRVVVPYPPGGGTDVIARIVQDRLRQELGQPLVIENRGGAAGSIGTELVAKADPDGYTVLFTLNSHTINPAIYSKLPFDTAKDFEPVATVASLPQILVAHPDFPAKTIKEVVELAKAKPDSISYASVGNGSPGHLAGELFKLRTGTKMTHIPYRGGGPAVIDVMGGQVPLLWVSIPAAANYVKQGKLRALAVSTLKRSKAFPDIPTVVEAGVPDFEVDSWYAVFVPAGTPKPVIDKWNAAINAAVREPDIQEKLLQQGSEGVGGTPAELGKQVSAELVKWKKLATDASIKVD